MWSLFLNRYLYLSGIQHNLELKWIFKKKTRSTRRLDFVDKADIQYIESSNGRHGWERFV